MRFGRAKAVGACSGLSTAGDNHEPRRFKALEFCIGLRVTWELRFSLANSPRRVIDPFLNQENSRVALKSP